ncbi:hypothetical protein ACFFX0_09990 [Citricoccus parietis]|uniref:Uncharacterized protein n=1 Tax=Citricoccus parietis TaxID=592307 RepID=A0ABV5FXZ4_9MICC
MPPGPSQRHRQRHYRSARRHSGDRWSRAASRRGTAGSVGIVHRGCAQDLRGRCARAQVRSGHGRWFCRGAGDAPGGAGGRNVIRVNRARNPLDGRGTGSSAAGWRGLTVTVIVVSVLHSAGEPASHEPDAGRDRQERPGAACREPADVVQQVHGLLGLQLFRDLTGPFRQLRDGLVHQVRFGLLPPGDALEVIGDGAGLGGQTVLLGGQLGRGLLLGRIRQILGLAHRLVLEVGNLLLGGARHVTGRTLGFRAQASGLLLCGVLRSAVVLCGVIRVQRHGVSFR